MTFLITHDGNVLAFDPEIGLVCAGSLQEATAVVKFTVCRLPPRKPGR